MSQKTNLNISPYYDDFNKDNSFYKVLFRPGRPVQARELTTLQSILDNQVKSFGSHIFKEGSVVIPGGLLYDNAYYSAKIESVHLGLPVSLYSDQLIGKEFKGQNSGVKVQINDIKFPKDSTDITDVTIFIKYLTGNDDNQISNLSDGEPLIALQDITYGNTTIYNGESVASLVLSDACAVGSAVKLTPGVYFIKGTFVNVSADTIVLDPYSNDPSYRVGLSISETIVTAKDDSSLYDNAKGFSNFAAPGADRLKITATLAKKSLDDTDDINFVELIKLRAGEVKRLQDYSVYNILAEEFAKRTYEESGDYSIDNFKVRISECLDDRISNGGVYKSNETTEQGNTPSEDLACVEVSPGKAYVKGFRIEEPGTTNVDFDKPRDTDSVNTALVPFNMGTLIRVNNVAGTPIITTNIAENVVTLYSRRKTTTAAAAKPTDAHPIGKARVYAFGLRNTPYVDAATEWNLHLFDVQTYTYLTLNAPLSADVSSFVRGANSGATGFINEDYTTKTEIALSETSGSFIPGEQIIINELEDSVSNRSIVSLRQYTIEDIKSVYQDTNGMSNGISGFLDFSADTILETTSIPSLPTFNNSIISSVDGNTGTITSPGNAFSGITTDSIIQYQRAGTTDITYNRVSDISADLKTLSIVKEGLNVSGVALGTIGINTAASISLATPVIVDKENSGLYAPLDNSSISEVNLANSTLSVASQSQKFTLSGNSCTTPISNLSPGITSAFFSNFDTQKYSLFYQDGSVEPLTRDQFKLVDASSKVQFSGLAKNSGSAVLNVTVEKEGITNKTKEYIRSNQIVINKTSAGVTTTTSGLTKNDFYGLRVEDKEISLNVPDVVNVVTILESLDANDPTLDKITTISGLSLDVNSVIGEQIVGSETGAVAQLINRVDGQNVEIAYLTDVKFVIGELITFQESNIETTVQGITIGNNLDITERYSLDKGQREQYYDYSRIVRKRNSSPPSRRILVVYNSYEVPSTDLGDLFTVNSYDKSRYTNDIPILANGVRATDVLDFRPRVSTNVTTDASPFAFTTRNFTTSGSTPSLVVSPQGDSTLGYSYYLPRIDKITVSANKEDGDGIFSVIKGSSSLNPKPPSLIDGAMHIATVELPAYLYNVNDAKISLIDNKRYTMRDIGKLEDRIENLEIVTSLSLLELDTKTLQIRDGVGDRFKSGFFVDDFKDNQRLDLENQDNTVNIDSENQEMVVPIDFYTVKPVLGVSDSINISSADFSQNLPLLDDNVQKTGDLITLAYTEVVSDIGNPQASRVENVNPYEVVVRRGRILLTPSSDNWTETIEIDGGTITRIGDRASETASRVLTGSRPLEFIRSRNVGFAAYSLTPGVRHYPFFEGRSGIDIVPKLIEISMVSGSFTIGETVTGSVGDGPQLIAFRTAQPNHKTGAYDSPTTVFESNPYDNDLSLGTVYTESTTVLNVDIASLTEEAQGSFFGRVAMRMTFVGQSSGAVAVLNYSLGSGYPNQPHVRLIPDSFGSLYGAFWFRNPTTNPPPPLRFTNGVKTFRLTSSSTNADPVPGDEDIGITRGDTNYSTSGTVNEFTTTTTIIRTPPPRPRGRGRRGDPLAQSFTVDETGMFLSSVGLYFSEKDDRVPLTVQIREMQLGTPTEQLIQDYAEVTVDPTQLDSDGNSIIKTSNDASLETKITFPSPVYLESDTEYAIVLLAPATTKYKVWIAEMNEETIETQVLGVDPGSKSIVQKQYLGGSLFKSQNGSIWTPTQNQDLKFKLYKCSFVDTPGTLTLFNSDLLSNNQTNFTLQDNALKFYPRKLKVKIQGTAALNTVITPGIKVTASNVGPAYNTSQAATGFVTKVGGPLDATIPTSTLSITGSGSGYDDTNSPYSSVDLYTITGKGSGATGTVTINSDGIITNVSIANTGSGYANGDVLGITTADVGNAGRGAELTVSSRWGGIDTLFLTNVQGEKFNNGYKLAYYSDVSAGTIVSADSGNVGIVGDSVVDGDLYTGNIMEVNNYNHSMKSDQNIVELNNVSPDTIPTLLTSDVSNTDTTISVANTTTFATFEGISTSKGYLKIGQEIMFYDGIGSGTLGTLTRGFGNSPISNHSVNDKVFKYELNGISLTGINTTHNMPINATLQSFKDIDSYYLEIPRGSGRPNLLDRSTGINQISFSEETFGGGKLIVGSKNFQYDSFVPSFNVMTPSPATTISAQLRSVSGTSEGGTEISFVDQGYENVDFNEFNPLSSPRLVCSKVDENAKLTNLPRNKSVTLLTKFNSTDSNLSPVLDTMNGAFLFARNRLNKPISDYATDPRSNAISGDPHAACYISQKVTLKQASRSLKVLVSAYRDASADFRVLYKLFKSDCGQAEQTYELFPGYDNLNSSGIDLTVIDPELNNGKPDTFVPASEKNEFKEYEFTAENLDEFVGFQIKIVISGTNEARPPRFKDLRAIALA